MDDLKNFLGYFEAWANAIDHHHNVEGRRSRFGSLTPENCAVDRIN